MDTDFRLCKWLRDNSSGSYRKSADAADRIEQLKQQLFEMQHHAIDCCHEEMMTELDERINKTLAL